MNVLLIMSDRHTAEYTGCYGNSISRTPAIDSVAARGARYDAAYCLSPTCAPSRASMMSGRFIHEIGTWCNAHPYTGDPPGWGKHFAEQGVHLTTIGKLDFHPDADIGIADIRLPSYRNSPDVTTLYRDQEVARYPFAAGYLRTGPADSLKPYRSDTNAAEEAVRWLRNDRPQDRPWVTVVNFHQGHRPWEPTQEIWDHYDPLVRAEDLDGRFTEALDDLHPFHRGASFYSGGHLISLESARRAVVGYLGAIEILDQNVGKVLSALDATGERDDTLVIYTSDHGGNLGEHRNLDHGGLYEESARIPLVIAGPNIPADIIVTKPVSALDLYPTVNAAHGLDHPEHLRGASLVDLATGSTPGDLTPALCQFHATGFTGSGFAYREGQMKYIACAGERSILFDLEADPLELNDLLTPGRVTDTDQETANALDSNLRKIVDPEEADTRCKAAQKTKRQELTDSGQLFDELDRRGFQRNADHLTPKDEVVFPAEENAIP